jgi:hypothetical protein
MWLDPDGIGVETTTEALRGRPKRSADVERRRQAALRVH